MPIEENFYCRRNIYIIVIVFFLVILVNVPIDLPYAYVTVPGDFEGKKVTVNGVRAAEMFCKVESCTPYTSSFTWLFIRPPWALAGACCKECVFDNMKHYVATVGANICILFIY